MPSSQMRSATVKSFDDSLAEPKLWYEGANVALKVSSRETVASVVSAIERLLGETTDENAAMVNANYASSQVSKMATKMQILTKTTIVAVSFEGDEISATSEKAISELFSEGDIFQVKVQSDVQISEEEPACCVIL
jgi:hypothetical protein